MPVPICAIILKGNFNSSLHVFPSLEQLGYFLKSTFSYGCNMQSSPKLHKTSSKSPCPVIPLVPVALMTTLCNHYIFNNICGRFDIDDNEDVLMDVTHAQIPESLIPSPPFSDEPQRGQLRDNALHILYFCSAIPFCRAVN